jgi:hypothetical protein
VTETRFLPPVKRALAPAAFFVLVFTMRILFVALTDDHFDRISRGRQVLQLGEVPFADFFDPGWFLAIYSSAAVQALFGYNLLGEVILSTTCIAVGFTLAFVLARRVSGSLPIAFALALAGAATLPRLYNYDKVLLFSLGGLLCCRYIERTNWTRVAALGVVVGVATLYRLDNGVYVALAALIAVAAAQGWHMKTAAAHALGVTSVALLTVLPAIVVIETRGSAADALRQILEYARREGTRTEILSVPLLSVDTSAPLVLTGAPLNVRWRPDVTDSRRVELEGKYSLERAVFDSGRTWRYRLTDVSASNVLALVADEHVEDTHGLSRADDGRLEVSATSRLLPGVLTPNNATAWLYYVYMALPLATFVYAATSAGRRAGALVLPLASLALIANLFLLRAPLEARIGDVAAPAVPLGAWLMSRRFQRRDVSAAVVSIGVVVLTLTTIAVIVLAAPALRPGMVNGYLATLMASPPLLSSMPSGRTAGLVKYIRECTKPDDRVLALWFAPEIYYFSGRGFAGGMPVFLSTHWSSVEDQERIITRLRAQSVPVVFEELTSSRAAYPLLDRYLQAAYRQAGETPFGNSQARYVVSVRRDAAPVSTRPDGLPCFA